jgi:hypothetical protein
MTPEERELYESFSNEVQACSEIAQRLDVFNPELKGAFTGTPSERIIRQLKNQNIAGYKDIEA